jgi:hypothetical protein
MRRVTKKAKTRIIIIEIVLAQVSSMFQRDA